VNPPRRAIVFSGGGARGAYEAGVVRYLVEELPKRLGRAPQAQILCGTSVGAIHACYMGATADLGPSRGRRLVDFWKDMRIEEVLPFRVRDVLSWPRRLFGLRGLAEAIREGDAPERLYGLLDTRELERMVVHAIPWRGIRRNVRDGHVEAVCVAATEIATGRVVVFMESQAELPGWTRDAMLVPHLTHLRPSHALASAALPVLFPVVRIADTYYADGGLRLNTPLSPAVRLGADRVLVVALRQTPHIEQASTLESHRAEDYANPAFLFGKVLNAVMLDHLDADLARMRVMNEVIEDGQEAFGPDFVQRLNAVAEDCHRPQFRHIHELVIRPSANLGAIAVDVLQNLPEAAERSPFFRLAMRNLGGERRSTESDLLSYLLFDGEFLSPLAELGFHDARAQEDELLRFFSD
jgi:NTE family protein